MKYCEGKTMCFRKPSVIAYAAVVGKAENEGPYGGEFDEVVEDNKAGSDTWEQAESLFQQRAVGHVLRKSGLEPDRIDLMIAGDLLNQCAGSTFAARDLPIPYFGVYGAGEIIGDDVYDLLPEQAALLYPNTPFQGCAVIRALGLNSRDGFRLESLRIE